MISFKKNDELEYASFRVSDKLVSQVKLEGLIMVKNQEDFILKTLDSIINLCDSVTVVDTGSTDLTVTRIRENFPSVRIKYLKWEENYGKMRNQCIEFIDNGSWILFIDSDETIDSELNYTTIHSFLSYLDMLYPDRDKICTVKQKHVQRPAFFHAERFIKKTPTLSYFGYVHEEPRSSKIDGLLRIDTDIYLTNQGLTQEEVQKFNKIKRYSELLQKNLHEEPNNSRWISLITPTLIEQGFMTDKNYVELLKKHILLDTNAPISQDNINRTPYLSYLLERLCVNLLRCENADLAHKYIELSRELFPYDANFVVFDATLFLKNIEQAVRQKLGEIIAYTKTMDKRLVHEASEGSEEGVSGVAVKMLCMLGEYENAKIINESISDELVTYMLTNENKIL